MKKYIRYIVCAFLAVVCFIGGRYAILNYLDKVSPLDALSYAEEHKYSYYDSASRLFLSPSDDDSCYIMHDEQRKIKYRVVFKRGFGKYSCVTFSNMNSDKNFSGSATVSEDALSINIECDSKEYDKLCFVKI